VSKIVSESVQRAIGETRGIFLAYQNEICDARFHKACGGITENFETAWEDFTIPYLTSVHCTMNSFSSKETGEDIDQWIQSLPNVFCNTKDQSIVKSILPSFDQETADFFRWRVEYTQEELSELILKKSGLDFGEIYDLIPVQRGPSGRIVKLTIIGSKRELTIGKELEIRKWLSPSHLYSSAFLIKKETDKFILLGAGWGHGVGLCQIGAAVMAANGWKVEEIVKHYFKNAELRKLY
jgi:SpoIID/LytB domain protein